MHQNYYFLKKVAAAMKDLLVGKELVECYKQKGDELIFSWADHIEAFHMKTVLQPGFSALCFPRQQAKPRKYFVNLFKELVGKKVEAIHQFDNERSFEILFEDNYAVIFQFFGRRSNVLLFQQDSFLASYRNVAEKDRIKQEDRNLDQTKEAFVASEGDWKKCFPTFGKQVSKWLNKRNYDEQNLESKWGLVQEVLKKLEEEQYCIYYENDLPVLTLLSDREGECFEDPLKATTQFTFYYLKAKQEKELREKIYRSLTNEAKKLRSYISKAEAKLEELQAGLGYKETADIIMANLHQIEKGAEQVELFDFYHDENVLINLKKELSPQKNAENFYRKSKNQKLEVANLEQHYFEKAARLEIVANQLEEVEKIGDYFELKDWAKAKGYWSEEKKAKEEKPFKEFLIDGFVVYVGKNAVNNDLLTLKYARKDDLWLHAKDVSGSHTVIKVPSGKKVPSTTIEQVASIAAYYSKRKSESLCPVIVTPKKFVRKRKGAPAGQVVVEREEVVLVPPGLPKS